MKTLQQRFDERYAKFKAKFEKYLAKHCTESFPRKVRIDIWNCFGHYNTKAKFLGYSVDTETEGFEILKDLLQRYVDETHNIRIESTSHKIQSRDTGETWTLLAELIIKSTRLEEKAKEEPKADA